jgi:hypothetical protein
LANHKNCDTILIQIKNNGVENMSFEYCPEITKEIEPFCECLRERLEVCNELVDAQSTGLADAMIELWTKFMLDMEFVPVEHVGCALTLMQSVDADNASAYAESLELLKDTMEDI